jgi:branched-chain amino acid transport system ATP-binding protein
MTATNAAVLEANGVSIGYGDVPIVTDLDVDVHPGEVVVILGPNGAGKTTTLLAMSGELPVMSGEVRFLRRATKAPLHRRARAGLSFVTEDRSVFMNLSAADNLRVGRCDRQRPLQLFPELEPLLARRAGLLSGGEQQMLTLARALAREPVVLLADELSMGLAPLVVQRLLRAVRRAADDGLAVLLVEQHVRQALKIADRVIVLRHGRTVYRASAHEALDDIETIEAAYLSTAGTATSD